MPYTITWKVKKDQAKLFSETHASVFRMYFVLICRNMDLAESTFTQVFHMYTESFNITDLILKWQ